MNKEYQIYEIILLGLKLTKNNLYEFNLDDKEIEELIENQIITRKNENEYELINVNGLYRYGVKLLLERKIPKANNCFYKCCTLDHTHRRSSLQILLTDLKKRNYHKLEKDFEILDDQAKGNHKNANDLYLYLINMITKVSPKYQERLKSIDLSAQDNENEKEIREAIIQNKFVYAIKITNDQINKKRIYTVELEVLKELLSQVSDIEKEISTNIYYYAKKKDYDNIIKALTYLSKKRYLKNDEAYIYMVTTSIQNIIKTKEIPTVTVYNANTLYEALQGNNFKLAETINNKFLKRMKKEKGDSILNILLIEINKLIDYLTIEELEKPRTINDFQNNEETKPLTRKKTLY